MRARRCVVLLSFAVSLACASARPSLQTVAQAQSAAAPSENAPGWIGRAEEIADYLKRVDVVRVEDIGIGVTNPKRAYLRPGGLVDSFSWKPLKPGMYRGYWESYKAEVAAYELDRLLGLGMVPVTVERRVNGDLGAAQMWMAPVKSFTDMGGFPTPPNTHLGMWNLQLIRAKMLDNLIYNLDPNQGNWLVDPAWTIFLIDHSRAFTDGKKLVHEMTRVDRDLWDRMKQLDEATLAAALGAWLSRGEVRAVLARRDLMAEAIGKLVATQGEEHVLVRGATIGAETVRPSGKASSSLRERVKNAVETPLFLPPASAVGWLGKVVRLAEYKGEYEADARQGVQRGHSLGLLTSFELVSLARDPQDAAAYDTLVTLVGRQVEIYGPNVSSGGSGVVQVQRVSPVP